MKEVSVSAVGAEFGLRGTAMTEEQVELWGFTVRKEQVNSVEVGREEQIVWWRGHSNEDV